MAATTDGNGVKSGATFTYDPYGQPLSGNASNTTSNASYGWVGGKQKLTEHQGDIAAIEMGARLYVPGLGRFLSVDPIEGGCANDYMFGFADPVNHPDMNGMFWGECWLKKHRTGISVGLGVVSLFGGPVGLVAAFGGLGVSVWEGLGRVP